MGIFTRCLRRGWAVDTGYSQSEHYCRPLGYRHGSIQFALDSAARLNYNPIDNAIEKHWGGMSDCWEACRGRLDVCEPESMPRVFRKPETLLMDAVRECGIDPLQELGDATREFKAVGPP